VTLRSTRAPLVAHQVSLFQLEARSDVPDSPAADVTLEGHWVPVRFHQQDGWVFDAYLSRYAAPRPSQDWDAEVNFIKSTFGVKHSYQWNDGERKTKPNYRLMRSRYPTWKDNAFSGSVDWTYIELKKGGFYEDMGTQPAGGGIASSAYDLKNVPLTFNEAMLWALQFGYFSSLETFAKEDELGKFSGKIKPGRYLHIGPTAGGPPAAGFRRTIDCSAKTCNLGKTFVDL